MTTHESDKLFTESIPKFYETYLVPLIFEDYAVDIANRVAAEPVKNVLEIAAGTGVVTRAVADALESDVAITATDLNLPMLDYGATVRNDKNVTRLKADALSLPFEDDSFDAVVCQFSVMFFPDRAKAYSEAKRVLKPNGRFLFSVWDHIGENEFANAVTDALTGFFPADPPLFLARTPHGYFESDAIVSDLQAGGFTESPDIDTIAARSVASGPSIPAIAYCQGTPLRNEIENRNKESLNHATEIATAEIENRFGSGRVDGKIQGHIVAVKS